MQTSKLTCPHCRYEDRPDIFENVGKGEMRCRRCRSKFTDPDAYDASVSYADCDSTRPVTRFPFDLDKESAVIRVRDGYIALLTGNGGVHRWIEEHICPISSVPDGFQLYYVCLSPRITWGASIPGKFGAYGVANLSLTAEYIKHFCEEEGRILSLEEHLKDTVNRYITETIRQAIDRKGASFPENRDFYRILSGSPENGISLSRVEPKGYRNAQGKVGSFPFYAVLTPAEEESENLPVYKYPAEIVNPSNTSYTVRAETEEVFRRGTSQLERHKAGENICPEALRGVSKLVRFKSKEFEYPFGWGIYNQPRESAGYFSAHGTVSFYIDSTERFASILFDAESWKEFFDQFFTNVLKNVLADALREIISERTCRQDFVPEKMNDYLSAMSVELTDSLNGESQNSKTPLFRQYGLRVKQTDIYNIDFYAVRR